jgi:hypothetical protein
MLVSDVAPLVVRDWAEFRGRALVHDVLADCDVSRTTVGADGHPRTGTSIQSEGEGCNHRFEFREPPALEPASAMVAIVTYDLPCAACFASVSGYCSAATKPG